MAKAPDDAKCLAERSVEMCPGSAVVRWRRSVMLDTMVLGPMSKAPQRLTCRVKARLSVRNARNVKKPTHNRGHYADLNGHHPELCKACPSAVSPQTPR
jgi:hypothetical protein